MAEATAGDPGRSLFFIVMPVLMLSMVFTGFTRTFYLHGVFGEPSLPTHLYVHGVILTIWFCLAFTQSFLIATERTTLHRRLGVAGIIVAMAIVAVNLVTLGLRDAPFVEEEPGRAFANLNTVFGFAICIASGVLLRHRPAAHKRLMLLASIQIVLPALDRMGRIPFLYRLSESIFGGAAPEVAFAITAGLLLFLALVVHDLTSERRIKWATVWGMVSILFIAPAISLTLIASGIWPAFVRLFI